MRLQNVVPHWVRDNRNDKIIAAKYEFKDHDQKIHLKVGVTLSGYHTYVTTFAFHDQTALKRNIGIKVNGNLLVNDDTEESITQPGLQRVTLRLEDFRSFFKEELDLWDVTNGRQIELLPENGDEPSIKMEAVLDRIRVLSCFALRA